MNFKLFPTREQRPDTEPILFIDGQCGICLKMAKKIAPYIRIEHLQDIGPNYHPTLISLASLRTSMILAEPENNEDSPSTFFYSSKGRAVFRLARYMPPPLGLLAPLEGFSPAVWAMTVLYTLFARMRKYL